MNDWKVDGPYGNYDDPFYTYVVNTDRSHVFELTDYQQAVVLAELLNKKFSLGYENRKPNIDDSKCIELNDHIQNMFEKESQYYYGITKSTTKRENT